jgi:hypothetical protein
MVSDKKTAISGGNPPLVSGLLIPSLRYCADRDQDTPDKN